MTRVIEADQVKDQEIRRRSLLESVGQPSDEHLVLQRLGAEVEMIRGTFTSVSTTTKSLGNSCRQMLSP